MRPVTLNNYDPQSALLEIERASHEADLVELAQNFTVGNAPSAQRVFLGSNIQASTTGVGNTNDTSEDVLYTYSLAASALSATGEGLSITAAGTLANNAHNKTVKLYFGAQVYSLGTVATANAVWIARMTVFKTASNVQLILAEGEIDGTPISPSLLTGAETDSAAITIKVTGQTGTAAASDVVAKMMTVSALASDLSNAFATFISDCQHGGSTRTT